MMFCYHYALPLAKDKTWKDRGTVEAKLDIRVKYHRGRKTLCSLYARNNCL